MHITVESDAVARKRDMAMSTLLGLAAILEAATGLVLMVHPALVAQVLFGDGVSGAGKALSRVAGFALLALGVACWPDREAGNASTRSTGAMLTYSLLVTIYLVYVRVIGHLAASRAYSPRSITDRHTFLDNKLPPGLDGGEKACRGPVQAVRT